jgi:hypothetical protein
MDDIKRPMPARPAAPVTPAAPRTTAPTVAATPSQPVMPTVEAPAPTITMPADSEPMVVNTAPTAVHAEGKDSSGRGRLVATVMIGVIVAGGLLALAFVTFRNGQTTPDPQTTSDTANTTTPTSSSLDTTSAVTSSDIDKEQTELETLSNTKDDQDLPEDNLSDENLGL